MFLLVCRKFIDVDLELGDFDWNEILDEMVGFLGWLFSD